MLVLSRKKFETIELHTSDGLIIIHNQSTTRVQIGIEAPTTVRIVRGELNDKVERTSPS